MATQRVLDKQRLNQRPLGHLNRPIERVVLGIRRHAERRAKRRQHIADGDGVLLDGRAIVAGPSVGLPPLDPAAGKDIIRFTFCKKEETLRAAEERLKKLQMAFAQPK